MLSDLIPSAPILFDQFHHISLVLQPTAGQLEFDQPGKRRKTKAIYLSAEITWAGNSRWRRLSGFASFWYEVQIQSSIFVD